MKYIAIDGTGGSGKTYMANALAEKLQAVVLHLDDYGSDYEPFVGIPKLIEVMSRQIADVVIFEGVGVFDEQFNTFDPFRIFVNTGSGVRSKRAASRDIPRSDRTAEEWKKIYEIWRLAEAEYFSDAILQKADLVTAADGEFDVDQIARTLARHLDKD